MKSTKLWRLSAFFLVLSLFLIPSQAANIVKTEGAPSNVIGAIPEISVYLLDDGIVVSNAIFTEADGPVHACSADPYASSQWHIQGISAPFGPSLSVALIDGAIGKHQDLPFAGIDNGSSHATHLAGIFGAISGNGVGISGLANANILSYPILDGNGRSSAFYLAKAIVEAANQGALIILVGCGGHHGALALNEAVDYANSKGATVIAPVGNDGGSVLLPAALSNVIGVGASNQQGQICSLADFGYAQDGSPQSTNIGAGLDILAPGVGIFSTLPGDNYGDLSGTSQAAAFVAGIAARIVSAQPGISPQQLKAHLLDSSAPSAQGYPIVDVEEALFGERTNPLAALDYSFEDDPDARPLILSGTPDIQADINNDISVSRRIYYGHKPNGDPIWVTDGYEMGMAPGTVATVEVYIYNDTLKTLRGFYFTEQIHQKFKVDSVRVKLGKQSEEIDISCKFEKGKNGSVLAGHIPYRWILETPPEYTEDNPFHDDNQIIITYTIEAKDQGFFVLNKYSWTASEDGKAILGYETPDNGITIYVELPPFNYEKFSPNGAVYTQKPKFEWETAYNVAGLTFNVAVHVKKNGAWKKVGGKNGITDRFWDWGAEASLALPTNSQCKWTVRAIGPNDFKTAQYTTFFDVYNLPSPLPISPEGLVSGTKELTFSWSKAVDDMGSEYDYEMTLFIFQNNAYKKVLQKSDLSKVNCYTLDTSEQEIIKAGQKYKWQIASVKIVDDKKIKSQPFALFFKMWELETPLLKKAPYSFIGANYTPEFEWNAVSGASSYELIIKTDNKAYAKLETTKENLVLSKALKPETDYTYTLRAKDDSKGFSQIGGSFSTKLPKLLSLRLESNSTLEPIFSFLDESCEVNKNGYYLIRLLQASNNKVLGQCTAEIAASVSDPVVVDFKDINTNDSIVLKFGQEYKIQARSVSNDGKVKGQNIALKFKASGYYAPVILSPIGNIGDLQPEIKWEDENNLSAPNYRIVVQREVNGAWKKLYDEFVAGDVLKFDLPEALKLKDKYRVRVRVENKENANDCGNWSPFVVFKPFDFAPPKLNTVPTNVSLTPTFVWGPDSSVNFYFAKMSIWDGAWKLVKKIEKIPANGDSPVSYTWGDSGEASLKNGKKYKFDVRAISDDGKINGPFSSAIFFAYVVPDIACNLMPGNSETNYVYTGPKIIDDIYPIFRWDAVDGATYYGIMIHDTKTGVKTKFENILDTGFVAPSFQPLKKQNIIRWRIRAFAADGSVGPWSEWSYIQVGSEGPELISVGGETANNPMLYTSNPSFKWYIKVGWDVASTTYELIIRDDNGKKLKHYKGIRASYLNEDYNDFDPTSPKYIVEYSPLDRLPSGSLTWEVKAVGLNDKTVASEYKMFRVANLAN